MGSDRDYFIHRFIPVFWHDSLTLIGYRGKKMEVPGRSNKMDRKAIATALAKSLAYLGCGKREEALRWARELIHLMGLDEILTGGE